MQFCQNNLLSWEIDESLTFFSDHNQLCFQCFNHAAWESSCFTSI